MSRLSAALSCARELVSQICVCGDTESDHGALHPDAEPGEKGVGFGKCFADDCFCLRFRRAPLKVVVNTQARRKR